VQLIRRSRFKRGKKYHARARTMKIVVPKRKTTGKVERQSADRRKEMMEAGTAHTNILNESWTTAQAAKAMMIDEHSKQHHERT
jgi:hypothetical protein